MAEYSITLCRSARKELEKLTPGIFERILPKLEQLADNPYPQEHLKIQGQENLWRIRVARIFHELH